MKGKLIYAMVIGLLVCVSGALYLMDRRGDEVAFEVVSAVEDDTYDKVSQAAPKEKVVVVYLTGAVWEPGIYEMPEGSRLYELIDAAGGMTEKARADELNLARFLFDGEMVLVPDESSMEASGKEDGQSSGTVKISINRAGTKELMTLTGIGEAKAEAIIAYRKKNGPFGRIEDIMKVDGIKDAMFNKIKDDISI